MKLSNFNWSGGILFLLAVCMCAFAGCGEEMSDAEIQAKLDQFTTQIGQMVKNNCSQNEQCKIVQIGKPMCISDVVYSTVETDEAAVFQVITAHDNLADQLSIQANSNCPQEKPKTICEENRCVKDAAN